MSSIIKNTDKSTQIINLIDKIRSETAVTSLVIDAAVVHCDDENISDGILYQWSRFSKIIEEYIEELKGCYISEESPE